MIWCKRQIYRGIAACIFYVPDCPKRINFCLYGIVNNRVKDYILLGRFSDYIHLVGCDEVMVEPQRLKYYNRNIA